MGSTVKKVMRPEILLPLAVIGTGGAALGAFGPAAKAAMVGKAAIPGTAAMSGIHPAIAATPATKGILGGLFGAGGKMSTAAKIGLGSGAIGGLASLFDKDKEPAKKTGPTQQEVYDLGRLMNQKMGGAMTNAQLNTAFAPLLSQYGGDKAVMLDPDEEARKRREMYRGLNYSGLTRGLADGGSIEPIDEEENRQIIMDALLGVTTPGMNEDAIAEQMFDMQRRERLNPTGRAMGGRIGYAEGDVVNPMEERMQNFNKAVEERRRIAEEVGELQRQEIEQRMQNVDEATAERARIAKEVNELQRQEAIERAQNIYDATAERHQEFIDMGFNPPPMKTIEEMFPKMDFAQGGRIGMDEGGVLNPEKLKDQFLNLSRGAQLGLMDAATNFQASDAVLDPFFKLMGMKKGGRVNMGLGGLLGRAFREGMEAAMKNPNLGKVFGGSGKAKVGDVEKIIKTPPRVAPRDARVSGIDVFGRRRPRDIDTLQDEVIDQMMEMDSIEGLAMGGSVPQTERMPNGMQIDGRGGGFIPMGARERKDDVPAMLAKNEFVMTADAVRGMGNGDVNQGAQKMYDLMNSLESKV